MNIALLSILGLASFLLIVTGLTRLIAARPIAEFEYPELRLSFLERIVRPIEVTFSVLLSRSTNARRFEQTTKRLALGGNPGGLRINEWLGVRYLIGLGSGLAVGIIFLNSGIAIAALLGLIAALAGYLIPDLWLAGRIRARQRTIIRAIPDILDLLTVSVQSGLGFDSALSRVVYKLEGPLADEFRRALVEIRLGKNRREAFRDIIGRTEVRPLTAFVGGIIQAEQLGVSISQFLQLQSEQLRIERRQHAEEQAAKAPVKMILPMAFFIFPALFAVILGPAIITIITTLSSLHIHH